MAHDFIERLKASA